MADDPVVTSIAFELEANTQAENDSHADNWKSYLEAELHCSLVEVRRSTLNMGKRHRLRVGWKVQDG